MTIGLKQLVRSLYLPDGSAVPLGSHVIVKEQTTCMPVRVFHNDDGSSPSVDSTSVGSYGAVSIFVPEGRTYSIHAYDSDRKNLLAESFDLQPGDSYDSKNFPASLDSLNRLVGPKGPVMDVDAVSSGHSLGIRTQQIRIATFGDSTASLGPANTDIAGFDPTFPASGSSLSTGVKNDKAALSDVYPIARFVGNGGISGQTTSQMLARDTLASAVDRKSTQDVLATQPDVIILRGGSINNLGSVTAGTLAATVATTYAEHVEVIRRLLNSGVQVIDEGIAGYSSASATDPNVTRQALVTLNQMYADFAATTGGRVHFLSPVGITCDAQGYMLENILGDPEDDVSYDGVHMAYFGARRLAEAEAAVLKRWFGRSAQVRYQGKNLLESQALMLSTSSVAYGTIATGWSVFVSGCTRQNAKVEYINNVKMQTCEFVNGSGSHYGLIGVPFAPSALGIASGDVYGFEMDIYIAGLDGAPAPDFLTSNNRVQLAKVGAGEVFVDCWNNNGRLKIEGNSVFAHTATMPFTVRGASVEMDDSRCQFRFQLTKSTTENFKMGLGNPRMVKLN